MLRLDPEACQNLILQQWVQAECRIYCMEAKPTEIDLRDCLK